MKRKNGGFSLGKSSDRYVANNPPLYNKSVQLGHATVADSIGDTFQSKYIPQQTPLGTSQYSPSAIYRLPSVHDQSFGTGLSQEMIQKIDELKRLVYEYRQYQNNDPEEIVRWAINGARNGDNRFLNEKLEQLRTIDGLSKFYVGSS
jgi:hypothetical protein